MATENGNGTVTVQKGDSLWSIASKYYKTYGYTSLNKYLYYLGEINNIEVYKDSSGDLRAFVSPGDVIKLTDSATTGGVNTLAKDAKVSTTVTVTRFGLISNDSNGLFVTWKFDKAEQTDHYEVRWYRSWDLKGIAPYVEQSVTQMYDSYTPPSEVYESPNGKVSVSIMPVSKTYKVKNADKTETEMTYYEGYWSTITDDVRHYYGNSAPTDQASAPSVEIEGSTLTAYLDDIPDDSPQVEFEVCKMSDKSVVTQSWKLGTARVSANSASYSWPIEIGYEYKVRCRYINANGNGKWSGWAEAGGTIPSASPGFTDYRAMSETEVFLMWAEAIGAESYELEYTTDVNYFDSSSQVRSISGIKNTAYFVTGLESGDEYFFRVRAINDAGETGWIGPVSVTIGTEPAAPTTWSSTTTVISGEELVLYWIHNSEDGSTQVKAEIELTIDGRTSTVELDTSGEEDDDKTMFYAIDTSDFVEGAEILWRVRTAGATKTYGEWSVQRTVTVYAQPTLSIDVDSTLTSFPLYIHGDAGPRSQTPIGYHISIKSNEYYETLDRVGNEMIVTDGQEIYSKYIDTSRQLSLALSAGDLDLQNNVTYTLTVTVSMNSGLTAEDTRSFTVRWRDEIYEPNAEIGYNASTYSMSIRPYCKDRYGNLVSDVTLSVYRREFNGKFTEIITGLNNSRRTYVTDPHPALDIARYRIVAISETTGAVNYCDLPGYPIGESAIIIQWDDMWRTFDSTDDMLASPAWSGSLLRLPYNIDVSENFNGDVSLVEYIGREHPVSYYGTQRGETATWNVEIPKYDKETLYGLRRLATWMGNVYVREPSGTGYWARIKPSFNIKHLATVIPITLTITRVEGGA